MPQFDPCAQVQDASVCNLCSTFRRGIICSDSQGDSFVELDNTNNPGLTSEHFT